MKLEINGLSRVFGAHVALENLSLSVADAHSLVLIGPSGSGKTTLLRVLAGLEKPDAGQVSLNGEPFHFREEWLRSYRRTIGVVFQAFNLFPHYTALENIMLPLEKVHGHSRKDAADQSMSLLRRFQLDAHAQKRPGALSGGQRQRVAIARALAGNPRIIFFDEPTSALDPEMTAEVLDMIAQLRQEKKDLVLVTHQMGFARSAADQVVFLAEGKVRELGPPGRIFERPQTEDCQRFLSSVLKY